MPTDATQLQTIRQQTLDLIEEIRLNPKPTYWLDGQRVHWQEYVESLERSVDWCDKKLFECEVFEIRSQGVCR
ncbi:hypothetical protein Pla123a_03940 [Posidoniimonas polymericola]|uniref:Uncharacterized protein n=1 Tax=Posidoniimonas polymericola TaxID=2528002 RepID=A0A5C5ZEW8_9BACT|nr:hypothetical protein [Posidoniimonas polymericola]TWT85587.1 hypothetical protein Pla123a_03940 [Posidoniimonas polymericola]